MLVRDVAALILDRSVVIIDEDFNVVWDGFCYNLAGLKDLLELDVAMMDFDCLNNCFELHVYGRHDDFHEIELLLSDCMRYADEGGTINYVAIMHAARRVATLAETAFARVTGRLS